MTHYLVNLKIFIQTFKLKKRIFKYSKKKTNNQVRMFFKMMCIAKKTPLIRYNEQLSIGPWQALGY